MNDDPKDSKKIELPFTPESALTVLRDGASCSQSAYRHKSIAEWCDAFWCAFMDVDAPHEIEVLLPILADVDCQWDLYLSNTYSVDELRTMSLDNVELPRAWFTEWLVEANSALSRTT